jgi:hypothetical protein
MRGQVRVVGRGVSRCSHAPRLTASLGGVPPWEAFPQMSRVLVERLLGLLACSPSLRMSMTATLKMALAGV